eukprot:TRINITY_DN3729_c0_g4_i1.p1 TRINITY_DN3729_c0_g4~~TRINITY_DN3729_c0_g4_i1.p1  ORF type:complete len:218 (-),score=42.99 TRINITY_DN3729_c0_g4_i1:143-757(-)
MVTKVKVNSSLLQNISSFKSRAKTSLIKNIIITPTKPWDNLLPNTATISHKASKSFFSPFNVLLKGTSIGTSGESLRGSRNKRRPAFSSVSYSHSRWKGSQDASSPKQQDFSSKYEKELITAYFRMISEEKKAGKEQAVEKTKILRTQSSEKHRNTMLLKRANCMSFKYKQVIYLKPQKDTRVYQSASPFKVSKIQLRPKSVVT